MGLIKGAPTTEIGTLARAWRLPAALLIVATLLLLGGDTAREWLRFERAAIAHGELWRLVTGHLVHLGWSHFALDGIGLVLVWYLVGDSFKSAGWALVAVVSLCTINLGLWFGHPALQWYVGLSGILHGILAAGLVVTYRQPRIELVVLGLLLLAKLGWEQIYGPIPGSEGSTGGRVIVAAHFYGAIGGILVGLPALVIRVRQSARL